MSEEYYKLKKLVKLLDKIKGRHTELVTVYIPAGYNIHEITNQLREEQSTAANIKSKQVRKNVISALEKIQRHLSLYHKTPEHGLAVFCGNVSEKEGVSKIELWAIEPPEPIKVKMYWCDQKFDLQPLKDMFKEKDVYGIINLDKSEADIAILKGKKIELLAHFDSIVPGKSRAGGQSSARFARVREGLLNDFLKQVGETTNKTFQEHKDLIGIIVSGPGPIKDQLLRGDYLSSQVKQKILGIVDTGYTGDFGLHETIEKAEEIIKDAEVIKEKRLVQKFFAELNKGGLVVYGFDQVLIALKQGALEKILISEDIDEKYCEYECDCGISCGLLTHSFCDTCKKEKSILGEKDLIEFFENEAKQHGTEVVLVSSDTREGQQFKSLGGVAGFLRYRI